MSSTTLDNTVSRLWELHYSNTPRTYTWRMGNLKKFKKMIDENMDIIAASLRIDLNENHSFAAHLTVCQREVDFMISNLSSLMSAKSVSSEISFVNFPARAEVLAEPVGPVLILGTWNYPYHSAWGALPGAIAAGNPVVVKPGFLCAESANTMKILMEKYFAESDGIVCVPGDTDVVTRLINEFQWGHIFFTGGTVVGKIIAAAAAKRLVPVTLELGGKNPCVVTKTADLDLAARRIAWGKWASNAGQVCLAPDHVLVDASVADELIEKLKVWWRKLGLGNEGNNLSSQYCKIISAGHFERLLRILTRDTQLPSVSVHKAREVHENQTIFPTIIDFHSDWETFDHSASMGEEIFGPILPVIRYASVGECVGYIQKRTRVSNAAFPLAMYVFSGDRRSFIQKTFITTCSSGAVVVNDVGTHIAEDALPFGGIGLSGMGKYHGAKSFEIFTHYRSVLWKSGWLDIPARYPPYSASSGRMVGLFLWLARKRVTPIRVAKTLFVAILLYKIFR